VANELDVIYDLASWPPFVRRVRAAMVKAAVSVASELADTTERSRLRRALSVNVFDDLSDYTGRFAIAVARNPVMNAASIDGDIEFGVAEVWDAIAGAPPAAE
jgi:hypothetical protein